MMKEITTVEEWESCLAESATRLVFIFKHSTRCPISSAAHDAVTRYIAKAAGGPEFHLVKVIESRPVSSAVAEALGIEHKSPQLILIKNGQAVWNASHYGINAEGIAEAVKQHS
jgi:bacillithiol system protein YtxJ